MNRRVIIIVAVVILMGAWLLASGEPDGAAAQERAEAWESAGRAATVVLSVIGAVLGLGVFALAYSAGLGLWERTHEARATVAVLGYGTRSDEIDLERQKLANSRRLLELDKERLRVIEKIYPDSHGNLPALWNGRSLLEMNRGVVFSIDGGAEVMTPALVGPEQVTRMLRAAGGWPGGTKAAERLLAEPEAGAVQWPEEMRLTDLLQGRQPSLNRLIVGGRADMTPIEMPLQGMMHTLGVAASGFGKSTWLRSFLWQVAMAPEPIEVVAIDISGSEFNALRGWDKLRYPVARTTEAAIAVMAAVREEIERRKALYEDYPLAVSLDEYNEMSVTSLAPWLVVIDEGTDLFNQPGIGEPMREIVQKARQYGLYAVVTGQSAKATVMDTQTRGNFITRMAFYCFPSSSQVVLNDRCASTLERPGQAFLRIPGHKMMKIMGPMVSREMFLEAVNGDGPRWAAPPPPVDEMRARVLDLAAEGLTATEIARKIHGYKNGRAVAQVQAILAR